MYFKLVQENDLLGCKLITPIYFQKVVSWLQNYFFTLLKKFATFNMFTVVCNVFSFSDEFFSSAMESVCIRSWKIIVIFTLKNKGTRLVLYDYAFSSPFSVTTCKILNLATNCTNCFIIVTTSNSLVVRITKWDTSRFLLVTPAS